MTREPPAWVPPGYPAKGGGSEDGGEGGEEGATVWGLLGLNEGRGLGVVGLALGSGRRWLGVVGAGLCAVVAGIGRGYLPRGHHGGGEDGVLKAVDGVLAAVACRRGECWKGGTCGRS